MKKVLLLLLASIAFLATVEAPNTFEVQFKLSELCMGHTEAECQQIVDYCRESLENGYECYYIN